MFLDQMALFQKMVNLGMSSALDWQGVESPLLKDWDGETPILVNALLHAPQQQATPSVKLALFHYAAGHSVPAIAWEADVIVCCHPQELPDVLRAKHIFPEWRGKLTYTPFPGGMVAYIIKADFEPSMDAIERIQELLGFAYDHGVRVNLMGEATCYSPAEGLLCIEAKASNKELVLAEELEKIFGSLNN